MGMYDYLKIKTDMLPISDKEKKALGSDKKWQTKDFECILSTAVITENGKLRFKTFRYEWDKNFTSALTKITGKKGALVTTDERWVDLKDYHGIVNFYTIDDNNTWYEFNAKFTDGQLVEIIRVDL